MRTKNIFISVELSAFLDFVRWAAALLVVLQHVRYLWFAEYANVQNKSLLIKIFYFFTGFGSEAVLVFFVLSGFLVGGRALRKWQNDTYSASDYFISRFSRIYTVLLPALICGGLLDWAGLQYFNGTGIYTNSPAYHTKSLDFYIANNLNWETFLANLANLQGLLTGHFGSNGPLWSLAYEWWYYCLFALILELLGKRRTDLFFWIFAAALLLAIAVLPAHLLLYMLIWGMGACVAILDSERFKFSSYVGWALFVSSLLGSRLFHILMDGYVNGYPGSMFIRFVPNLLLAAGFSILIVSLRGRSCAILRRFAFHKKMADFSYTVYLMHVPLLVFVTAILSSNYGVSFFVQPATQVFLYFAAIVLVIYIALYLFSLLTERFTPNVKASLTGFIFANRLESKAGAVR